MRLSNRKKESFYGFINSLLLMVVFTGIVAFFLELYKFQCLGWESILFIIIPVLMWFVFYLKGRQIFEYDSDGEALNFKNKNVVSFFSKPASDEFPKYKLLDYEVVDILVFKRLYIKISSKKTSHTILKYDISYLSEKEINDLKFSLNKVIRSNKER